LERLNYFQKQIFDKKTAAPWTWLSGPGFPATALCYTTGCEQMFYYDKIFIPETNMQCSSIVELNPTFLLVRYSDLTCFLTLPRVYPLCFIIYLLPGRTSTAVN